MEDENLTPEEKLNAENEIEKMRLEMDFGPAQWGGGNDVPPELTSEFLKSIRAFHEHEVEEIPLLEFLGNPTFVPADVLSDEQVEKKIETLFGIMADNSIHIDRPVHLSGRDFYKFLITDFMKAEVDKKPIPGMNTGFIYAEFVPDCLDNVYSAAEEFISTFFSGEAEYLNYELAKECGRFKADGTAETKLVPSDEIVEKYARWNASFKSLTHQEVNWGEPEEREGYYQFPFHIKWSGELEDGSDETYEGEGYFQLVFDLDIGYFVRYFEIPGFKF